MPLILIIIGIIAALGFGGFIYLQDPADTGVTTVTPVARIEEVTTTTEQIAPVVTENTDTTTTTTTTTTVVTPPKNETTPKPPTQTPPSTPTAPVTPTPQPPVPTTPSSTYKDGSYVVTTSYNAPGRSTHTVVAKITLANDTITDSTVTFGGDNVNTSSQYQEKFVKSYSTQVIGKKLDSVSLSRVGGASLTTNAFNKALVEVKTTARS